MDTVEAIGPYVKLVAEREDTKQLGKRAYMRQRRFRWQSNAGPIGYPAAKTVEDDNDPIVVEAEQAARQADAVASVRQEGGYGSTVETPVEHSGSAAQPPPQALPSQDAYTIEFGEGSLGFGMGP